VNKKAEQKTVLVGVLKSKRDLEILLKEKWYRIPVAFLPKKKFEYIALYQPAVFGREGKRIQYYGQIADRNVCKRIDLLPKETSHPRAEDDYAKFEFQNIEVLDEPIRNIIPRRVSFGFTTLKSLKSARDILQLYGVPPTEQIIERRLKQVGIPAVPEHRVSIEGKKFRIDLAIIHLGGKIAIECDNKKAHAGKTQRSKDEIKNKYLQQAGWRVIRLKEADIIERLDQCVKVIQKAMEIAPTLFQKRVYNFVRTIPKGKTMSYAQVAEAIGRPRAYRAVGNALNRNPYILEVPCHRVIRSDGSIGGFNSGTARKKTLLRAEGAI